MNENNASNENNNNKSKDELLESEQWLHLQREIIKTEAECIAAIAEMRYCIACVGIFSEQNTLQDLKISIEMNEKAIAYIIQNGYTSLVWCFLCLFA